WHWRFAVVESLGMIDSHVFQHRCFFVGAYPFGDGFQLKVLRKLDEGAHEYLVFAATSQSADKRTVDLDDVHAQHFQVVERRESRPETVNCHSASHFQT